MANTLETLKGQSLVAAHNSTADLVDKTPLQAYRGATVSQLATAARIAQKPAIAKNTSATLNGADDLKNRIITSSTAGAVTLTLPTAAQMVSSLTLEKNNDSFEFTVINTGGSNAITVAVPSSAGVDALIGSGNVAANSSAQFRIRAVDVTASSENVQVFRVA